jgi:hypothetical protein
MNYARAGRIRISKTAVDRPASRSELRTNFPVSLFHRSAAKQEYFADDVIRDPFYKALAVEVNDASWICVAMDQLLGRATGHIFNDEAAAVATGTRSPEQAAGAIEMSWSENRI